MELKVVFISLLTFFVLGTHSATYTYKNNCPYTIWPATQKNRDRPTEFSPTGFELPAGAQQAHDAPADWAGRIWARTGCSNNGGGFTCVTANCGSNTIECNGAGGVPPASLAEFNLRSSDGNVYYDISLVDGFNLPLSIKPDSPSCPPATCSADVNAACPPEFRQESNGATVGCKSACARYNEPQFCCSTEQFNTAEKCPPSEYSKATKKVCPEAYSYAFDDRSSLVGCPPGANYLITFCP